MKNSMTFEEQTEQIVEALLSDFIPKKPKIMYEGPKKEKVMLRGLEVQPQGMSHAGKIICLWGSMDICREMCWSLFHLRLVELEIVAGYWVSGSSTASTFDPVTIASRLRDIGDQYNEDLGQLGEMIIAEVTKGKLEKFGETVDSLSKQWISQNSGLQYETAFLAVAVKLFVYVAQKTRNAASRELLTGAINENPQVRGYIERQGGWENL
ncbi:bcl-2-like protein 15 [Hemicordylus capensis]|uniref:bcl-2-like protein 15 n=1 Tax=Hemicordylus capensis TaxID=884348 RepID=UPI002304CA06|nr:bcl-2-like protein 15 [Hemicordylus capensis]